MGFGIPDEGGNVGSGEEGVGKYFGGWKTTVKMLSVKGGRFVCLLLRGVEGMSFKTDGRLTEGCQCLDTIRRFAPDE